MPLTLIRYYEHVMYNFPPYGNKKRTRQMHDPYHKMQSARLYYYIHETRLITFSETGVNEIGRHNTQTRKARIDL